MFFSKQAEKGIVWHIDARSVVWTLINNGKLANQIARLVAIVVKKDIRIPWDCEKNMESIFSGTAQYNLIYVCS